MDPVKLGIKLPSWLDALIVSAIKNNSETIKKGTDFGVSAMDDFFEDLVQKTDFQFDNVGKEKVLKALTKSMVEKYMPELLQ